MQSTTDLSSAYERENFVLPVPDRLLCAVCMEVLNNPYQCQNGHMLCHDHMMQILHSSRPSCPTCRAAIRETRISRSLLAKDTIDNLEIRCIHARQSDNPCFWTGPLSTLSTHLTTCASRASHIATEPEPPVAVPVAALSTVAAPVPEPTATAAFSDRRVLFVRNIPYDLSVEEFEALFDPHGTITSHNIMMRGACRVAYVNYSTPEEAHAALSLNGHAVNDRNLMVTLYRSFSERNPGLVAEGSPLRRMRAELPGAPSPAEDEPTYVVVCDWPSTGADDTTRALLSIFNGLTSCRIIPNPFGRTKAQLLFESRQFAVDAAEMLHGIDVEGHRLGARVALRLI